MRYENLTRLLSEVVTDSGKIDYLRLLTWPTLGPDQFRPLRTRAHDFAAAA
jgi:hypothetical protein